MILTRLRRRLNVIWFVYAHFFRADLTAMKLRQYDVDEFGFHIQGTYFHCLSNDHGRLHRRAVRAAFPTEMRLWGQSYAPPPH